jgi:hypothetical protein
MSDVVDLTLLSSTVQEIGRELRLLRLQVDQLASVLPQRLAVIEQSFHDLVGEVSRGFGQVQQQATRQEKRLEAVDAGLTALRGELAASTARIIQVIEAPRAT